MIIRKFGLIFALIFILTSCDIKEMCYDEFSRSDNNPTCTYETDSVLIREIEGISEIEKIEFKPMINYQDTTYIFDYNIRDSEDFEYDELRIYKATNYIAQVEQTFTFEENITLKQVLTNDTHFLILGYIIPTNANSDTYLQTIIIEIPFDLSSYTMHKLASSDMRIPFLFAINTDGEIGIIGERMPMPDDLHSGQISVVQFYDTSYEKQTHYEYPMPYNHFGYNRIQAFNNQFIVSGVVEKTTSPDQSTIVKHIFDNTGLIHTEEINSNLEAPILITVLNNQTYGLLSFDENNHLIYRTFNQTHNIIDEQSVYIDDKKTISGYTYKVLDKFFIFTHETSHDSIDSLFTIYLIEENFSQPIESFQTPFFIRQVLYTKNYIYRYANDEPQLFYIDYK